MRKQTFLKLTLVAGALALLIPAGVAAQSWPDYRNDDDYYRRNRDYDRYGRGDLRDSIRRLDRLADQFERDLDRTLDRSRENGSRHEDHLNADTREFRRAVRDLRNNYNDGRNYGRSDSQIRRVLDTAAHVEDEVEHHFNNQRLYSEWQAIRQELNTLSNVSGYRGANNGEDYGRRRNDDDYRRDRTNDWWRRIRNWPN